MKGSAARGIEITFGENIPAVVRDRLSDWMLSDKISYVRCAAMRMSVAAKPHLIPESLIECLNDRDPRIRGTAAYVVAKLMGSDAESFLKGMLDDPEFGVRRRVETCLHNIRIGDC